jgi:hypothetical protein
MPSLKEILALLTTAQGIAERLEEIWQEVKEYIDEVKDEKKRKALLDACEHRDPATVRKLLFD